MTVKSQVTMKDIAREAGVSRAAVSHALNERYKSVFLTEKTRKHIKIVARRMGYVPNEIARSMVSGRTRTVAYIDNDLGRHDYSGRILSGIMQTASANGHNTKLFSYNEDPIERITNEIVRQRVSGVICRVVIGGDDFKVLAEILKRYMIPLVSMVNNQEPDGIFVVSDDKNGVIRAIEYLHGLGHRRIAMVGRNLKEMDSPRSDGFKSGIKKFRLNCEDLITECNKETFSGAMQKLMAMPPGKRPTAIFCTTDPLAMKVLQLLYDMEIKVPDMVSVIGFGGMNMCELASPSLTTITQPFEEMGRRACQEILKLIGSGRKEYFAERQKIILPVKLTIRNSAGPVKN